MSDQQERWPEGVETGAGATREANQGAAPGGTPAEEQKPAQEAPAETRNELEEVRRERDQFKRMAQQLGADFINYRNRAQSDVAEARKGGARRLAIKVVEALDLFETALAPKTVAGVDAQWVEGMKAVQRSLASSLASESIERMSIGAGDHFDPRKHEALLSTPTYEFSAGSIIRELRPGYTHHGDVIRPAQVEVAISPPTRQDTQESNGTTA